MNGGIVAPHRKVPLELPPPAWPQVAQCGPPRGSDGGWRPPPRQDPEAALTLAGLLEPVLSLLASLAMGTAGAAVVGLLLRPKHGLLPAYLRPGLARKLQAGVILGLVVLMFGTADLLQVSGAPRAPRGTQHWVPRSPAAGPSSSSDRHVF